jgi:D-sedoheptulose 7-phosphate isomerase
VSDDYTRTYLDEAAELTRALPVETIEAIVDGLAAVRDGGGRLFILGVGGGAGHASHAVNDFRKICHLESYAPTDNVSELTARINDDGWETAYAAWLRGSRIGPADAVLVFSVGGGSREHGVSTNLVAALDVAREVGAKIYGIVGKPDGETARVADACVVVPAPAARRTPHVEAFQAVVWHLVVSHPRLSAQAGKWESVDRVG